MSQRQNFPSKRSSGNRGSLPSGTGASRSRTGFAAPPEEPDYLQGNTLQPCRHLGKTDKWSVNRSRKGGGYDR
jgi:hypothetical protein